VVFSVPPNKCRYSTLNCVTDTSFNIRTNSLLSSYHTFLCSLNYGDSLYEPQISDTFQMLHLMVISGVEGTKSDAAISFHSKVLDL
jgi:hypothetical protein